MLKSIPMLVLAAIAMTGWAGANDSDLLLGGHHKHKHHDKYDGYNGDGYNGEMNGGKHGKKDKKDWCNCCYPFGLFFQKVPTLNSLLREIPISFDTTAFSTKDLQLDPATGGIQVKKPGYYFLEYAVIVRNDSGVATPVPYDVFVRTSDNVTVLGSGAPTFIGGTSGQNYDTLATSVKICICDDCTQIFLGVLNPSATPVNTSLVAPNIGIDVPAVLDIHWLGGLDCVCHPCDY